ELTKALPASLSRESLGRGLQRACPCSLLGLLRSAWSRSHLLLSRSFQKSMQQLRGVELQFGSTNTDSDWPPHPAKKQECVPPVTRARRRRFAHCLFQWPARKGPGPTARLQSSPSGR